MLPRYVRVIPMSQLDRIEAAVTSLTNLCRRIDLEQRQQISLYNVLYNGVQIMSNATDATAAAVTELDAKVDAFIAAIQPGLQNLRDQLAAAQAQVASLQAGDTADAAALGATVAAAQAETAKVQAAIDALTPPVTP